MKVYNSVQEFREYIDGVDVWGKVPVYMTSGGFDPLHVGHLYHQLGLPVEGFAGVPDERSEACW